MISHDRKFIFIHIPKVAGTSIEATLRSYASPSLTIKGSWPDKHKTWRNKYLFDAINAYPDYFSFAFVRNPWDRLISNWKYFSPEKDLKELIFEMALFLGKNPEKYYREIPNNFCTRGISVSLESINHNFPRNNFGYHVLPQVYFLQDDVKYVGRFETLQNDWDVICHTLELEIHLPHLIQSGHKHYAEYYDDESRDAVAKLYKEDIERFDYSFGD